MNTPLKTCRLDSRLFLFLAAGVLALICSRANADTIYRETFGNNDNANRKTPNLFGWQAFDNTGNFFDTTGSGFGIDTGATLGRPTDVANINAGGNVDGSTGALAGGRPFWNGAHRMLWTPEYQIDPANYQAGSIVFSFYLGDANAGDTVRIMVRVGTTWYVSTTTFSSPVTASADFSTTAVFSSLTYNPAAANWLVLNFDGTYNGGGWLNGPAAVKTASSINPVSIGATPGSDLSGVITGFGIIQGNVAANPAGNIRFDTFQVDAIPGGGGGGPTINGTNVWKGTVDANWDYTTLNWATLVGGVQTNYPQNSFAIFDDTVLNNNTNIVLTTTLTNAGMLVSNSTAHYIWTSLGNVVGSGGLTKVNNGTLIIANTTPNTFSGPVDLQAGTIQLGNGNADVNAGNIGSGALTNNGALLVNMGAGGSVTVNNAISGSGIVANIGSGTLSLGGSSTFTSGLTVSNGPVRLTGPSAAGTGTLNDINNAMLIVSGAGTIGVPLVVSNGFLGSASMGTAATGPAYATNSVTFVTGTTSTIMIADPQNLTGASSSEVHIPGTLHGGGDINVIGDPGHGIDAGAGFRLQGSNVSDYSGTITISNTAKGELQTTVAGPFSPMGTGKLRLEGGVGGITSVAELNLRNSSGTNTVYSTDVEIIGTGVVSFNAPIVQSPVSIGTLKVGDGQIVGANKNNAQFIFPTVTLNGGIATFAPGTVGLAAGSGPASITLSNVSELIPVSGMTMSGSNVLTLAGDATYTGPTFVSNGVMIVNGRILHGSMTVAGDGLTMFATLGGTGAITAPVAVSDYGTLQPGASNTLGTLSISNTLNLNTPNTLSTTTMKLNRTASPNADLVQGITTLTAGGTLNVSNLGPTLLPGDSFKLFSFGGRVGGFVTVNLPGLITPLLWNTNSLLSAGTISVTVSPNNDKLWTGSVDGNWDTTTSNWKTNGIDTTYTDNDLVRFTDSATRTTVNLAQNVSPGLIIVSNNAANFAFTGSSKISGTAGLVKYGNGSLALMENGDDFSGGIISGGGTLILSNTAVNISGGLTVTNGTVILAQSGTFAGNTSISGGVVQVGNNTATGDLPTGAIANNSVIVFNRASTTTVPGVISGAGQIIQSGTNTVKLSGANTYTGGTLITNGFLQVSGNTSLGAASAGNQIIVTNGGSLDLGGGATANSITLQASTIQVSGAGMTNGGAIMNSGLNQQNGLTNVTMLGDTVFGGVGDWHATGNPGRWDIRGAAARLNTGGQPFKLTKVGGNQVNLVNVTVDPQLGDVDIQGGQFGYEAGTTSLGNTASNLFVRAGATLEFFGTTNVLNKVITVFGDGATTNVFFNSGVGGWTNVIVGPMSLNSGTTVVGGNAIGTFSNIISGAGDLAVNGGTGLKVFMAGTNNYTGNTTVRGGSLILLASARLSNSPVITTLTGGVLDFSALGALAVAPGQLLTNGGILTTGPAGTLTVGTGSTVLNSGTITAATFTATSTSTVIDNGTIVGNISAGSGATIAGNGTVAGNLTLNAGGILSPGGAGGIGRITSTLSPSLGSSPSSTTRTLIEIDKSNLATNDQVFANGAIIYGGRLTVSNIGPALVAGDTFKIFNGSTYALSFTLDLANPGVGLTWNTNNLGANGTLSVISAVTGPTTNANITSVTLSGTNLLIHGTNNNVPNTNGHYVVLTATNLSTALSNWTPVATNPFNADGTFDYTQPIVPGTLQQFMDVQAVP
jgi:fibronectin-binding autotransporter adhesin